MRVASSYITLLTVTAPACRNCLGQQLAKINVPTAVAMLTREFHMTLASQVWCLSQLLHWYACRAVKFHSNFMAHLWQAVSQAARESKCRHRACHAFSAHSSLQEQEHLSWEIASAGT